MDRNRRGHTCYGLAPSIAPGAPIAWTLQNVTFVNGATAQGSFIFDAASNQYSNVNLSISALPGSNFQFLWSFGGSFPNNLNRTDSNNAADLTGAHLFELSFVTALTNAG